MQISRRKLAEFGLQNMALYDILKFTIVDSMGILRPFFPEICCGVRKSAPAACADMAEAKSGSVIPGGRGEKDLTCKILPGCSGVAKGHRRKRLWGFYG